MLPGKFVILNSCVTLPEARHAAQRLQAAGIPAYIRGEAAALIAADPDRAVVCLEVAEDDLEHAQRVLAAPPGTEASRPAAPDVKVPPDAAGEEAVDADLDRLATVEVFYDPLEAKHAADLLRARGIACTLEGTSEGILPGLSPGIANLRLVVREGDLERSYEILGFTVDEGEGGADDVPDGAAPKTEHFQEAEPRSSGRVRRPPFVPLEVEGPPSESTASVAADDLGPPPSLPTLEAGSGGPDIGLILLLLVVGGIAVGAAIWLFLL